jgi:hypothetical protein
MNVSDMSANAPVGTTLALLERQLKVMGAVQSRMHYSMKQEFKLLKTIIADYAPEEYSYEPEEGNATARKSDYENVDVIPVSDPNASTMAQKVVQYQAALQLAQTAPQLYDLPLLHRQMLEVLGIKNAAKLVPIEDDLIPVDPIQENQNILMGKPVKAFIEQDHKAHIQVHMLAMQDPQMAQIIGQNPQAQMLQQSMMAHINEHVGFEYRRQIQERMGFMLPTEEQNKKVDDSFANQIALAAAKAAQELFQKHSQESQAQQAQQQMQDPVLQMQMKELEIKAQELQLKAQKQQIEAAEKADRIRVEESRIAAQKEIAAMQVAANAAMSKAKISAQQEMEGTKLGIQIAREKSQSNKPKPSRSSD